MGYLFYNFSEDEVCVDLRVLLFLWLIFCNWLVFYVLMCCLGFVDIIFIIFVGLIYICWCLLFIFWDCVMIDGGFYRIMCNF